MRRCRLHVVGGSGAGTTTLGRGLADFWAVPHADADDYFWVPTDPTLWRSDPRPIARESVRQQDRDVDSVAWEGFLEWARGHDDPTFRGRSRAGHEAWLETLSQPVLRLDSALPRNKLRDAVLDWEPGSSGT